MAGKPVRFSEETLELFDFATEVENEHRAERGLTPIGATDLLRHVCARFVGLPVPNEIDLDALQVRMRERQSKRPKKPKSTLTMETPPTGGATSPRKRSKA